MEERGCTVKPPSPSCSLSQRPQQGGKQGLNEFCRWYWNGKSWSNKMGPSKKNKVRFNLEKRTNTSRGKIIQNADSVGATNLESSTHSKLPFHSPKSALTFQCTCTRYPSPPRSPKSEWHFPVVLIKLEAKFFMSIVQPFWLNRQNVTRKVRMKIMKLRRKNSSIYSQW